jgi:sugar (pentulose or hexulose) kinase
VSIKNAISAIEDRQAVASIGVSAMMHGYLTFDSQWQLLTPFRTWQNTVTGKS